MPRWTIDGPATIDLGDFAALRVRLVSGSLAILATDQVPALDVASLTGQPLLVKHEAGILTVGYEDLQLDGLLGWLRPQRHAADITLTVPAGCPMRIGVVNASATVAGVAASISAKSLSGDLTLDDVTGAVEATTVSGNLEARGLDGEIVFSSLTGGLTLASTSLRQLAAKTVSGQVTADIDVHKGGGLRVITVSGDVAVRLPACSSVQVDLKSTSGRVQCTFDGMRSSEGQGPASVKGTLGSGSASLSVASMSGDVTLLSRAEPAPPGQPAGPAAERQGGA
jgi:Putative adhesin